MNILRPLLQLREREVRTADETELRRRVFIFPHDGIAFLYPLQLRVVNDIGLRIRPDQRLALLRRLRRQVIDVIESHSTVGCGRRAEILQVGARLIVQLCPEEAVQAKNIRHLLHHLHADSTAQQLGVRLFRRADLHAPGGLSALVSQETEFRHAAGNGTEELYDTGVPVASRAEHRIGIDDRRALRPAEDISLFGLVADLVEVAGAGRRIVVHPADLPKLFLIGVLFIVHEFSENKVLKRADRNIRVERLRIDGKFLF